MVPWQQSIQISHLCFGFKDTGHWSRLKDLSWGLCRVGTDPGLSLASFASVIPLFLIKWANEKPSYSLNLSSTYKVGNQNAPPEACLTALLSVLGSLSNFVNVNRAKRPQRIEVFLYIRTIFLIKLYIFLPSWSVTAFVWLAEDTSAVPSALFMHTSLITNCHGSSRTSALRAREQMSQLLPRPNQRARQGILQEHLWFPSHRAWNRFKKWGSDSSHKAEHSYPPVSLNFYLSCGKCFPHGNRIWFFIQIFPVKSKTCCSSCVWNEIKRPWAEGGTKGDGRKSFWSGCFCSWPGVDLCMWACETRVREQTVVAQPWTEGSHGCLSARNPVKRLSICFLASWNHKCKHILAYFPHAFLPYKT